MDNTLTDSIAEIVVTDVKSVNSIRMVPTARRVKKDYNIGVLVPHVGTGFHLAMTKQKVLLLRIGGLLD